MFVHSTKVRIPDTDAAGILFFGNQFRLIHEAFEEFLYSRGSSPASFIDDPDYLFPMVHAEADYKRPIKCGDELKIQVQPEGIGNSSVTLKFTILGKDDVLVGTGKTILSAVNKSTWTKVPVPEKYRGLFSP